ncbi:hypothetical protein QFZ66_000196 [Streptomyces sp. B4I13]|nr:hypothetical protein [Streptomyces sp. B4I13]
MIATDGLDHGETCARGEGAIVTARRPVIAGATRETARAAVPDAGGHKILGRDAGPPIRPMGVDYIHCAADDHTRIPCSEAWP